MQRCLAVLMGTCAAFAAGGAMAQSACESYTVQRGDTLAIISERAYGTPFRFRDIYEANQNVLTSGPSTIFPGEVLEMPCATGTAAATKPAEGVSDDVIAAQRTKLAAATDGQGFGPQSPRDLATLVGANKRLFSLSPPASEMNLCNIHFHESAEHRGGQFTTYAGNGNGKGYGTGFKYDGTLSKAELAPVSSPIGQNEYGSLEPGDTIEIHFVHSSAQIVPGPTLGACISEAVGNPQLRVETVVAVLVNDPNAADLVEMSKIELIREHFQAPNIPTNLGTPIEYTGSTTGPSFNEKASPFQVSWSVRPNVVKMDINSVGKWLDANIFEESYAHGVRNLVTNPDLISDINK